MEKIEHCNSCNTPAVKLDVLHKHNYLSEFLTEAEKALARFNLGLKTKGGKAEDVAYTNNKKPLLETVKDALDMLIDEMDYSAPTDWEVSFSISSTLAYLGTSKNVTWSYSIVPKLEFPLLVIFDGVASNSLSGLITKTVTNNTTVNLNVTTSEVDSHGSKPKMYNKDLGITFIKPCVYWTSTDELFSEIPTNVEILELGKEVACGDNNLYIYIAVLQSNINNIKIKTPDTEVYDKGFVSVASNKTLSKGSIPGQISSVDGYYVYRTGEMLKGSWNIKY